MSEGIRGPLKRVFPRRYDVVYVLDLDERSRRKYIKGYIDNKIKVLTIHERDELGNERDTGIEAMKRCKLRKAYRVVYGGVYDDIRIEIFWERRWYKRPIYREVIPKPLRGDKIAPRGREGKMHTVFEPIIEIPATGSRRYDYYHLVAAQNGSTTKLMWVRWSYSGHLFTPIVNQQLIKRLQQQLPR